MEVPRPTFSMEGFSMRMTAPSPDGVSVGGTYFTVTDGHITVPDDYSAGGIAALLTAGFAPVADQAPVVEPDGYGTRFIEEAE